MASVQAGMETKVTIRGSSEGRVHQQAVEASRRRGSLAQIDPGGQVLGH